MKKISILIGTLAFGLTLAQEQKSSDSTKTNNIEAVTISKKYIQQKADRMVYDVSASPVAKGNTAFEVLKKTPTVNTTDGKEFKIMGKSSAVIYINGRKSNMNAEALLQLLKSTPSENLAKVEVISSPGSEYQVEGDVGIINIVLKKKRTDGFNGTLKMDNEQAYYNSQSANLNLNYRKDRLGVNANVGYGDANYYSEFTLINGDGKNETMTHSKHTSPNHNPNLNLILDYELNDNSQLNLNFNTYWSVGKNETDESLVKNFVNGQLVETKLNKTLGEDTSKNYSAGLNYDWKTDEQGSMLKLNAAYMKYNRIDEKTNYLYNLVGTPQKEILYGAIYQNTPQDIENISAMADYIWKLKDGSTMAFGGNYNTTETDNDTSTKFGNANLVFTENKDLSNHFIYKENIGAVYANYERTFGDKVSAKLGLRYEMTATKGDIEGKNDPYFHFKKDYNNLLPFANLTYQINPNHMLRYSFSSRVKRPSFWELNPVRVYTTEHNFVQNNPFMKASTIYQQQLMYMLKNAYFVDLGYSKTKDASVQIPLQKTVGNITQIRYIRTNYGDKQQFSASLGMQKAFFKGHWINSLTATSVWNKFSGMVDRDPLTQEQFPAYYVDFKTNFVVLQTNNQIALDKSKTWWLDVGYFWVSKQKLELGELSNMQKLDLGLKKNWNDWTFKFNVEDVFNTTGNLNIFNTQDNGYYNNIFQRNYNRSFNVSVTYNFGNKKLKKVQQVESANSDIQSRMGK